MKLKSNLVKIALLLSLVAPHAAQAECDESALLAEARSKISAVIKGDSDYVSLSQDPSSCGFTESLVLRKIKAAAQEDDFTYRAQAALHNRIAEEAPETTGSTKASINLDNLEVVSY